MTEERDNSAKLNHRQTPSAAATDGKGSEHLATNPYQAPPVYASQPSRPIEPSQPTKLGATFGILAAVSIILALALTVLTGGLALPLLLGLVGGTIRTAVISTRGMNATGRVSPALLLVTSTFVTIALLFSCTIAFATVCAGTVLATGTFSYNAGGGSDLNAFVPIWSIVCGTAALAAFIFLFLRSTKWSI